MERRSLCSLIVGHAPFFPPTASVNVYHNQKPVFLGICNQCAAHRLPLPDGGSPGTHITSLWGHSTSFTHIPFYLTATAPSTLGILSHSPSTSGNRRVQGFVSIHGEAERIIGWFRTLVNSRPCSLSASLAKSPLGLRFLWDAPNPTLRHSKQCGSHLSCPFAKRHQAL